MPQLRITLKNDNEPERQTQQMLENIAEKYQIEKWIRCPDILIEQGASGKAFPIVRISAWQTDSEDRLLGQFIHEQFHWIEKGKEDMVLQAIAELKKVFPGPPTGTPLVARNERSTYGHLMICRLELLALKELLGEERARQIVSINPHYTWIREQALNQGEAIDSVIAKYFPGALGGQV